LKNLLVPAQTTHVMEQGAPSGTITAHPIRLKPGDDLVPAIEAAAAVAMSTSKTSSAFVLTAVGSLEKTTLRMANACRKNGEESLSNEIREWDERMEVVSLVGTLSPSGKHLHMSLSDKDGLVVGGHLVGGRVFTTMELVLGTIQNVAFQRDMDDATGYRELVVKQSEPPK
jgi:predicted DNA-binding protein with PD1-like motif